MAMGGTVLPATLVTDPVGLEAAKTRVQAGDAALKAPLEALLARAQKALQQAPLSVVSDALVPPSGDRHDYMSVGPYWWPNPATPNGLPYVRKDGEVNPERDRGDNATLGRMQLAVRTLCLAYYLTGDERYADHAARLLRTWFLDPETRMNANLNYGQAIPGVCDGRGTGIIDTVGLIDLVDRVGLVQTSPHWTKADQAGLVAWFGAYVVWLQTSEHGRHEAAAKNNHGSWYDAQVAAFALFAGHPDLARRTLAAAGPLRIARQIQADGRQPEELQRTKSWSYSWFNLSALTTLAALGRHVDVDLWHYATPDGRSIRRALDYLAPYVGGTTPWPHPQIQASKPSEPLRILLRAAYGYGDESSWGLVRRLPLAQLSGEEELLLNPVPAESTATAGPAAAPELPLVILLGDSIRAGYQPVAVRELAGTARVWAPEENCAHTAHTLANLDKWLAGKSPALVHLNCGLHDLWRNEDGSVRHAQDVYLANLAAVFAKLRERVPQATLVFALTTPVDQERQKTSGYGRVVRFNADVPVYNAAARELAVTHGVLVDDLYAVVERAGTATLIAADGVHFNPAGYEVLGKAVADCVRAQLAETHAKRAP